MARCVRSRIYLHLNDCSGKLLSMAGPRRLLVVASDKDHEHVTAVLLHLAVAETQGQIIVDAISRIAPGESIENWLDRAIAQDDAALLFLSRDFLADERIQEYILPRLLERVRSGLQLLLLPLRPCVWHTHPGLAGRKALMPEGEFLSELPAARRERATLEIAMRLIEGGDAASPSRANRYRSGRDHREISEAQAEPVPPSRARPPAPAHWGYVGLLSALFLVLIGTTVSVGPRLLSGQQALITVTALLAISLLAAFLLAGVLRATGRLQLSGIGYLTGAAGICGIIFVLLYRAVLSLAPPAQEWLARGHVEGLPPGALAWIQAPGCAEVPINRQNDRFELPIHGPCDQPQLSLIVRVAGSGTQTIPTPRATAQQDFSITWQGVAQEVTSLSGILRSPDNRPVAHVFVRLAADCPEAATLAPAESGADGAFQIPNLPASCRQPPYHIRVSMPDGRILPFTLRKPWGDFVDLPEPMPTPKAPIPSPSRAAQPRARGGLYDTERLDDRRFNVLHLLPGHGLERGRWLGLFRTSGGGERALIGYGVISAVNEQSAALFKLYLENSAAKSTLLAGPLPPQPKIGKALGTILQTLDPQQVRINLGQGDGVRVGDRYRVLGEAIGDAVPSGSTLGREGIGTLQVEQADTLFATANIVDGRAPQGSFIALQ